jgi:hypothetical protein
MNTEFGVTSRNLAPLQGALRFCDVPGVSPLRKLRGSTPGYRSLNPSGSGEMWGSFLVMGRVLPHGPAAHGYMNPSGSGEMRT